MTSGLVKKEYHAQNLALSFNSHLDRIPNLAQRPQAQARTARVPHKF